MNPRVDTALFAVGFLLAGLVLLALAWSGAAAYEDLARANAATRVPFVSGSREVAVDLPTLVEYHRRWSSYVTGGTQDPPSFGEDAFTADEYAHMADVRRVFEGARLLVPAGLFLMAFRLQRARARSLDAMLRLARDGAVIAGIAVAAIGVVATVAFEPLFLLFHYVFFPQGNFLFDPRTSNLVRLYPDWYWEGITLRIGASYLGLATLVWVACALALRRSTSTRLASA